MSLKDYHDKPMKELNAWGKPVGPVQNDKYYVPARKRSKVDEGEFSTALDDVTGDDLDGWKRGDPIDGEEESPERHLKVWE